MAITQIWLQSNFVLEQGKHIQHETDPFKINIWVT